MPLRFGILFIALVLAYPVQAENIPQQVCISKQCFDVEIARTQEERRKGLQFRESLEAGTGMLFVFSESARHNFWMKDTLISLDIIWIDEERQISFISSDVQPCAKDPCPVYSAPEEILYVLEINGGVAEKLGFKKGDEVVFK